MFSVIFYETQNGKSPAADYIGELDKTAQTDKAKQRVEISYNIKVIGEIVDICFWH